MKFTAQQEKNIEFLLLIINVKF